MTTAKPKRSLLAALDIRDAFFFGGLVIASAGGAFISMPRTAVIVGAVLALKAHGPIVIIRRDAK